MKTDHRIDRAPDKTEHRSAERAPERHESGRRTKGGTGPLKSQNFDASLLDHLDQLDLSQADALFDPEKLAQSGGGSSGDRISFDDAMMQGIIGDMEEDR